MNQNLENTQHLFRASTVFAKLNEDELREILNITERRAYKKNEVVFAHNQTASFLFMVENGSFILNLRNSDFKAFRTGDVFGETALINENLRTGSVRAVENSTALAICGDSLFDAKKVKPATALKVMRALAERITNYLRSREQVSTWELIKAGETEHVEFKSSLRWNKHTNKKDQAIEHAILKTLAGFMNSEGGTLLIGVNDDGEPLGLAADQFANSDKMMLHLTKLINDRIGQVHHQFVNMSVEEINGKEVFRVDCEAATMPAYLSKNNEDYFFVRSGPSTVNMNIRKIYDYIQIRFGGLHVHKER